ncbi:MAG: thiamine biosynthesis protein ThiF [Actinobacteria bacterium]|nr:thiamine biosynthesis protein ThiF [Actinomycetota bacterium]
MRLTDDVMLGPATRLLWRAPDSVQLELGEHAVVVEGLPVEVVRRVAARSGPAAEPTVGVSRTAGGVLDPLTEAGYLWPRATDPDDLRLAPGSPRLAGELAALATQHGDRAAAVLADRRRARVQVEGGGRMLAAVASVLAAAGVGQLTCVAAGTARLTQTAPGGLTAADEGRPLAAAAEDAVHRAAPEAQCPPPSPHDPPDLTLLVGDEALPDERVAALQAVGRPYLAVVLGPAHGVVGPLVIPGLTSCPECADRHRRDRDPAWDALAVQLRVPRRHGPPSDVTVVTTLAGVAAQQALTYLDGGVPTTLDGTLELWLPDWRLRRRSRPQHPPCSCQDDTPIR